MAASQKLGFKAVKSGIGYQIQSGSTGILRPATGCGDIGMAIA
jgi:hypothetical protein